MQKTFVQGKNSTHSLTKRSITGSRDHLSRDPKVAPNTIYNKFHNTIVLITKLNRFVTITSVEIPARLLLQRRLIDLSWRWLYTERLTPVSFIALLIQQSEKRSGPLVIFLTWSTGVGLGGFFQRPFLITESWREPLRRSVTDSLYCYGHLMTIRTGFWS